MNKIESTVAPAGPPITNIAAYKFVQLDRLTQRRKQLYACCRQLALRGTILLSAEGINLFVAGARPQIEQLLAELRTDAKLADLDVKYSYSDHVPFRRMLVKIKQEIISMGVPQIRPERQTSPKLSATELKQWLDEGRPVQLLDVRNDYEIKVGAFEDAVPIGVDNFREFPAKVSQLPDDWKQTPIVMYCTGGIRCEKAGPLMEAQGFEKVYQLEGGILKYFETVGGAHYAGDCFVFDQRVAVDPCLDETDVAMCFCCQATLTTDEQKSPQYVVGQSCPYCYQTPQQSMATVLSLRSKQLNEHVRPLPGCVPYENRRPINVPLRCDQMTVWDLITRLHPHVPLDDWRRALDEGRVQRDGVPLTAETTVRAGQRIENVIPGTVEPAVNPRIQFIYEDAALVVVNKPAPLPMHPCGRYNRNSLISILNQVYQPQVLRVAHRLDANTTGAVVFSRTRPIAGMMQPQFETGGVKKTYLARVDGHPSEDRFSCDAAINEVAAAAGKREVVDDGLASLTEFEVALRADDGTSILLVRPLTGRTNQIRLHLAHLGWPIVGDATYGRDAGTTPKQTLRVDDPPMCLHAWKIQFRHPLDGKRVEFVADPPDWAADIVTLS